MIRPIRWLFTPAALALLFASGASNATPSVRDVVAAIDAGNIHSADVMLQDVLAAHPNNARAHFIDAQVLGMENRADDGLQQLQIAEKLDPALKFASAERVAKVESKLKAELAQPQAYRPAPPVAEEIDPAIAVGPTAQPAEIGGTRTGDGGHTAAIFGIVVAAILALLIAALVIRRRRRARAAEVVRRDMMRRMTTLLGSVRELLLDSRLSADGAASVLAAEAAGLRGAVSEGLTMLSDGRPFPETAVESLEWRASDLRSRLEGRGSLPTPGSGYHAASAPSAAGPSAADWRSPGFGSPTVYAPQTVFVDNGPDLITATMLAEAMRPAPLVVERDVFVDTPPYLAAESRDVYSPSHVAAATSAARGDVDDDLLRGGGRDLDVGNGGSDWSDGSGGTIDTGSDSGSGDWS